MQVLCLLLISFIWVGLEVSEEYFRATTAAKLKAAEIFCLSGLISGAGRLGQPLSGLPAIVEGATHQVVAPLKNVPILGDVLENAEQVGGQNIDTAALGTSSDDVNNVVEEPESGEPVEPTLEGTDQAGETLEQPSPI